MPYEIRAYEAKTGPSSVVFFLCSGDETPLASFQRRSGDDEATAKIKMQLESVHKLGVATACKHKKIRALRGGKASDLYEIRANNCAARAFSFLIDGREAIVVAFIDKMHSGNSAKDIKKAIRLLESKRPNLEEALEERETYEKQRQENEVVR